MDISICIPTYNGLPYLEGALGSVLDQTYREFEVLISDDGSTDGSLSLIDDFEKSSPFPARVFRNKGLGISGNCNFLANEADGQFLKFLFQDDLLDPSCIEVFLKETKAHDCFSLAFSDRRILFDSPDSPECQDIFNGCQDLSRHWSRLERIQEGKLLLEDPKLLESPTNKIGEPSNTFISKSAFMEVGGFDSNMSQLLDLDLWFRLMTVGNVVYIKEKLSKFRIHESQQSVVNAKANLIHRDFLNLYSKILTSKCFGSMSVGFRERVFEATKPLISAGLLKNERKEFLSTITKLSHRIKFMESTFSWKLRKHFMKIYYLFNSKQKKVKRQKIYKPLTFKIFGKIHFEKPSFPKVSVIIPFFEQYEVTWLCLKALESNGDHHIEFEVILVNDFSSGNNDFFNCLNGVKIVKNEENLGFLKSCNRAVESASGEYLVFLNNDTQIQKGWLISLVEVLESNSDAGAVGSKLIYPDNKLQEAGGIIWSDASGSNYGKGSNHNLAQYNFLREVDYCSGASLAIPKSLFMEMGAFDEKYSPAYFEDTDICFKIRSRGKKVYYQPKSIVIHLEGTSCGKSEDSGIKSYQKRNRETFHSEWESELSNHFPSSGGFSPQYKAANRLNGRKTILVIDSSLPYYDKDAGGYRIYQILKILKKQNFHVIFLAANEIADEPYATKLSFLGIEVLVDESGKIDSRELLRDRLEIIDVAWICRPQMFEKFGNVLLKKSKIQIIYDTIDLHYLRLKREWELKGSADRKLERKWKRYLKNEKKFSRLSDQVLTVTKDEAEKVKGWNVQNVSVLPTIHIPRTDRVPSFEGRQGILFIGSYLHPPNVDAVNFLIKKIMPMIWESFPEIPVTLLGSNPSDEVIGLGSDRVSITGFVEDVAPYFDLAKVFVCPLRFGAGIKGKIGQSMSLGLPVVTTSIGAEGMGLENGSNALIADERGEISKAIQNLLEDEDIWGNLSREGISLMKRFSPEVVSDQVAKLFNCK